MEPKGWSIDKRRKSRPYKAQITINNQIEFLGYHATPEEAHAAFVKAREANPRLPHSGGATKGTYTHPRKICPNCKMDYAKTKYAIHYEACLRNYPEGKRAWSLAPKRKKKRYIKKAEREQNNGQQPTRADT